MPEDAVVASMDDQVMGDSLLRYVSMKVHIAVRSKSWSQIIVRGVHTRTLPAQISSTEKHDKPFNWQRPTATVGDARILKINCFPGHDYVQHYAAVLATYLSLLKRGSTIIQYIPPNATDCLNQFINSNLSQMGHMDVVVVGSVHHLERFITSPWEGGGSKENDLFAWQRIKRFDGRSIALLGCMISFWGDISGHLVRALQKLNQVKVVLYIGKAGTLCPQYAPNRWLASGSHSSIEGRTMNWNNPLGPYLKLSSVVLEGLHVTVPSPLFETRAWLEEWRSQYSWVDCEVGHMAQASNEGQTLFGYLHVVSDNLAAHYPYDLSNERLEEVIIDRKRLFLEVENILEAFFAQWTYSNMLSTDMK
jgi:hypothetical protein